MARWAIAYDICRSCIDKEFSRAVGTAFYDAVKKCLADHGFSYRLQQSIYTCPNEYENSAGDVFRASLCLQQIDGFDKYMNALHSFRLDEMVDLLDVFTDQPSDSIDPTEIISGLVE